MMKPHGRNQWRASGLIACEDDTMKRVFKYFKSTIDDDDDARAAARELARRWMDGEDVFEPEPITDGDQSHACTYAGDVDDDVRRDPSRDRTNDEVTAVADDIRPMVADA